jgi:choline kinase
MVRVIGIVLAAGAGRRLAPLTDDVPKTLLPVAGSTTILDLTLGNMAAAGIHEVAVVTGFADHAIESRRAALERRHGVHLRTVFNERALDWNNAYSLWLARDLFADGALLCNGDTVHPAEVEHALLAARGPQIVLAVDDRKVLGEEEMKVVLDDRGRLLTITKGLDPGKAAGEYIGVTVIEGSAAAGLADALEATWRRDPGLYYEDGYQEYVDRGGEIHTLAIGPVPWVEVDNHADLARAREIACHY